jgi:hypothetical protein
VTRSHPGGVYPRLQLVGRPDQQEGDTCAQQPSGGMDTTQQVEIWAQTLVELVMASHAELAKTAPKTNAAPGGHHYLPKGVSRQRRRLVEARACLARAARSQLGLETLPATVCAKVHQTQEAHPAISLQQAYQKTHRQLGAELREVDQQHISRRRRARMHKVQALIDTKLSIGGD